MTAPPSHPVLSDTTQCVRDCVCEFPPCFPASLPPSLPLLPLPSFRQVSLTHSTARARTRETRVTTALPAAVSVKTKSVSCALSPMFLLRCVLRRVRFPRFGTTYGAARPSSVSSSSAPPVSSVVPSGWRLMAMCCSGDVSQTLETSLALFFAAKLHALLTYRRYPPDFRDGCDDLEACVRGHHRLLRLQHTR